MNFRLGALFILGLSAGNSGRAASADKLKICIGDFPSYEIGSEAVFQQKDDFEVTRTTVEACLRRFKAGYFDLTMTDSYMIASEFSTNPALRIVSVIDYSDGTDEIISAKDLEGTDLRGSTWALETNTGSALLLSMYLEKRNLTLQDVNLQFVRAENTTRALSSKRISGIVTWQPYGMRAKSQGGKVLASSADYTQKVFDVVVTTDDVIQSKRALVARFIAEQFLAANDMDKVYRTHSQKFGISDADAQQHFQDMKIYQTMHQVRQDQSKVLNSILMAAKVHDIVEKTGELYYSQVKKRLASMLDLSLLPDVKAVN